MYENNEELSDFRSEKVSNQPVQPSPEPQPQPIQVEPAQMEPIQTQPIQVEPIQQQPIQQVTQLPQEPLQLQESVQPAPTSDHQWGKYEIKVKEYHCLIKTLHKSMTKSEEMIQVLLSNSSFHHRRKQILLLHECTDVCGTTYRCILRNSPFSGKMTKMCARVCRTYYQECAHYTDTESRMTAKVLMKCAYECRKFSEAYRSMETKNR